jgi:esterase/lipase superfamily enzyme
MARACAPLIALALSACGSLPTGFLLPEPEPAPPPGVTLVDMLVTTTRRPSPEPGVVFGNERDVGYSGSEIVVSVPPAPNRKIGLVQWPEKSPPDPLHQFTTVSVKAAGPDVVQAWFDRVAGPKRRLLVFVHGYNTRFETAVYLFAQIVHDSGAQAAPVLFTWPSGGKLFDYEYDRDSAMFSRDALEALLNRAAASPRVQEVVILAHSMGTYLAMEAIRQTAIRNGGVSDKIRTVILASPDIDPQLFARQFEALGPRPPHVTIFVTSDDRALLISRWIARRTRLGSIDPSKEPYRSRLEANRNITVIDLSKVKSGDSLNHGKFAESPDIVQLIGQRLINGQPMSGAK